jgi:hypothetical protein
VSLSLDRDVLFIICQSGIPPPPVLGFGGCLGNSAPRTPPRWGALGTRCQAVVLGVSTSSNTTMEIVNRAGAIRAARAANADPLVTFHASAGCQRGGSTIEREVSTA